MNDKPSISPTCRQNYRPSSEQDRHGVNSSLRALPINTCATSVIGWPFAIGFNTLTRTSPSMLQLAIWWSSRQRRKIQSLVSIGSKYEPRSRKKDQDTLKPRDLLPSRPSICTSKLLSTSISSSARILTTPR